MTTRSSTTILLVSTALAVACAGERVVDTPVFTTLEVAPTEATILQSGSAHVGVTLTRTAAVTGAVNFTLSTLPAGITAVVSNVQSGGRVTTATISIDASSSAMPGRYVLTLIGTQTGSMEATTTFMLTVEPSASCPAGSLICEQWATDATASSEYTSTFWSAKQATLQPNSAGCEDEGFAWASLSSATEEWLELKFQQSVRPTEIQIYEVLGVSSIVKVEVKDQAGAYHIVYAGQPGRQTCPRVLTLPITGVSIAVNAVRLSIDQRTLNDWNEIDAVKLVGQR